MDLNEYYIFESDYILYNYNYSILIPNGFGRLITSL